MKIWENDYIKLLRINHWFKNLFIFFGVISALWLNDYVFSINSAGKLIIVFLLASVISSVNYIINQITDAEFDSKHPQKKNRPIPSGRVSKEISFLVLVVLFFVTFFISLKYFSFNFTLMIFTFWLAGIFYNVKPIRLKDLPYLDVLSESANNPIRFLIGWFALVPDSLPPISLLFFSWTIGAFLMTAKRYDELLTFGKDLVPYRNTFKFYSLSKLKTFLILYLVLSVVLLTILILKINMKFIYSLPIVLVYSYWLCRSILSGKAKAHDIEKFVLTKDFIAWTFFIVLTFILIGILL